MSELRFIKAVCGNVAKANWPVLSQSRIANLFSPSNVTQILHQLSSDTWLSLSFYNWADSLPHYHHSLEPNWTMVHLLTKNNQLKEAHELLESLAPKSQPSIHIYLLKNYPSTSGKMLNWLVIYYSKSRLIKDALKVFDEMRNNGIKPGVYACSALVTALGKEMHTSTVWKVFDEMLKLEIVPNRHIYNSLLYVCSKSNNLSKAEELVAEMEKNGVLFDIISYNNLVMLLCKKGLNHQALNLLSEMRKKGVNPDIITYNSIITGFCIVGKVKEAEKLFKEINGEISPNNFTYETLIKGYCRDNDPETAIRLLNEMEEANLPPDLIPYSTIIYKLCDLAKMERAHELLDKMLRKKIKPKLSTFMPLINAYCNKGDWLSVCKIKNNIVDSGLKLDIITCKKFIQGFCKAEKVDEAKDILFCMIYQGSCVKYSTVSLLVECFFSHNRTDEILTISEKIPEKPQMTSEALYTALIQSFCKRGLIDNALKLFDEMISKGFSGNRAYIIMSFAYLKEGKTDNALKVLNEMVEKKLDISAKLCRFLDAEFGCYDDVLKQLWIFAEEKGLFAKSARKLIRKFMVYKKLV